MSSVSSSVHAGSFVKSSPNGAPGFIKVGQENSTSLELYYEDHGSGPPVVLIVARQDRRTDTGERFFRRRAHQGGIAERKAMIDRKHDLPITRQAEVLSISRGSVYYLPRPVSATDLEVMRRLDRLHLGFPFAGSRMLRGLLVAEGCKIGRRHVKTLMQRMGIEALYRRPRTTKPEPGHKIYPYLLRGMAITRPNQVWAMDITYIPMARGFVYLAVVLDSTAGR